MSVSGASSGPSIQGMYTRNLIGNCAGSAFRLQDTKDKIGIWFVMQDLSVRTEGSFRCVRERCLTGLGQISKAEAGYLYGDRAIG